MVKKTINGFVFDEPRLDCDVFVLSASVESLAVCATTLRSIVSVIDNDSEIIIFTIGLEEIDYKRLERITGDNDRIFLSIYPLDNRKKLPFLNLSCLTLDDIAFFIPFMLKRYTRALYVNQGVIFNRSVNEKIKDCACVCYKDNNGKECMYRYNVPLYTDSITLKDIRSILMETDETDIGKIIKCILDDCEFEICEGYSFEKTQDGFSDVFLRKAKETMYYEKILYDLSKNGKNSRRFEDQRPLVHIFPFEVLPKDSNIVIYGFGDAGRQFVEQMRITRYCNIVAIVDKSYKSLQRRYNVSSPDILVELDYDYVVIANASRTIQREIVASLLEKGIDRSKIISMVERNYRIDSGRIRR